MPDKMELLLEAERRGLLPPDKIAILTEARSRGLIGGGQPEQAQAEPAAAPQTKEPSTWKGIKAGAKTTLQNLVKPVAVGDAALNLVTSAYGIPASGIAGLVAMTTDEPDGKPGIINNIDARLDRGQQAMTATQNALIHEPKTAGGEQLAGAVAYPLEKLNDLGAMAGGKLAEKGYPNAAATAHSLIAGSPAFLMAKGKGKVATAADLDAQLAKTVEKGMNKGVRPSVAGKELAGNVRDYHAKAMTAVEEIVKNKNDLKLTDAEGNKVVKLPENLKQFSESIEQTKREIYKEYTKMAEASGNAGAMIPTQPIIAELAPVLESVPLMDHSPSTVQYAKAKIKTLQDRGGYSVLDAQDSIQKLNESLDSYYKNPTPARLGKAYVDAIVANNLRSLIDDVITKTEGPGYAELKQKYGALRSIEGDVTKRAIVDDRKNTKGLIDFTDVFSGYHLIQGVLTGSASTVTAGIASKIIAGTTKLLNDPNTHVKKMFKTAEKLVESKQSLATKGVTPSLTRPPEDNSVQGTGFDGDPYNQGPQQPVFPDTGRNFPKAPAQPQMTLQERLKIATGEGRPATPISPDQLARMNQKSTADQTARPDMVASDDAAKISKLIKKAQKEYPEFKQPKGMDSAEYLRQLTLRLKKNKGANK